MMVLDTNIISEMMRPVPNASVVAWLNEQDTATLFLTTITVAEVSYGLSILPGGKRRRRLGDEFKRLLARGFQGRTLGFDLAAAEEYAAVMSHRRRIGRPLSLLDGQIAATARAHGCGIATRNVRDFEECGLDLINPFG